MYADNLYIALYDEGRQLINFPFYRDDVDPDIPTPTSGTRSGWGRTRFDRLRPAARSPALDHGIPLGHCRRRVSWRSWGRCPVEWMGAPLKADGRTVGVLAVQTYREDRRYGPKTWICSSSSRSTWGPRWYGHGPSRRRGNAMRSWRSSTRSAPHWGTTSISRRSLSLSAIALASFETSSLFIALHDEAAELIRFAYELFEDERIRTEPMKLGEGLTSHVIAREKPLRLNTTVDLRAAGGVALGPDETESWLGVPILAGDRVIGVIGLESLKRNAYTESDERLLSTLASSMGVALENARLFDETKRLLAETDERAAELRIINEIGSALAKQLDFPDNRSTVVGGRRIVQILSGLPRRHRDPAARVGSMIKVAVLAVESWPAKPD